jgi:hypothetical protein
MSPLPRATATLLLPERSRLAGQRLPEALARRLARADVAQHEGTPLARVFDVLPRGWPAAAVTRQRDVGDAAGALWLRADPAYVRPDINGARLLACGDRLAVTREQADALSQPLRPLFGDAGFALDAPDPARWYLRLPAGTKLPHFAAPDEALGADLFDHLPSDTTHNAAGRRWRTLLGEAQIVLHNHPVNAERAAQGLPPVNSVWFWGAGPLPDRVATAVDAIHSNDEVVQAFAQAAGIRFDPLPERWQSVETAIAFDLRPLRDAAALHERWLSPLLADLQARRLQMATFLFEDGLEYTLTPGQRWRFWRRPLSALPARAAPESE